MLGPGSFEIPDLPEPIRAYRFLMVGGDQDTPILMSQYDKTKWPTRSHGHDFVTARCVSLLKPGEHEVPCEADLVDAHHGSGCGIYGYKTIEDVGWDWPLRGITPERKTLSGKKALLGIWVEVSLWGRVFEHNRGYRAEFGRIESIVHIPGVGHMSLELHQWIADSYGVPVTLMDASTLDDINDYIHERKSHKPTAVEIIQKFTTAAVELTEAMKNLAKGS